MKIREFHALERPAPGTQRRIAMRSDAGEAHAPSSASAVPAARGEFERNGERRERRDKRASRDSGADGGPTGIPALEELAVRDVLDGLPALVALVYGPDHRVAYVNDAYADAFGPREPGTPAAESCPELAELGLTPLLEQVSRSGTPRTVKSRKVQTSGCGTGHTPADGSATPTATAPTP